MGNFSSALHKTDASDDSHVGNPDVKVAGTVVKVL